MSKESIRTSLQVFLYLAEACSEKGMESAEELFVKKTAATITDDEEAKKYVHMFDLLNPENMIRFFVDGFVPTIESCHENLNGLKAENLQNILGEICSAAGTLRAGIDHAEVLHAESRHLDRKDEKLISAQQELSRATEALEKLLQGYINQLQEMDHSGLWKFFRKAKFFRRAMGRNVKCAKHAVEGLEIAVRLQLLIAMQRNMEIASVAMPYLDFMKKTAARDVCSLLHAYDTVKWDEYWEKLPQKIALTEEVMEVFEKYRDHTQQRIHQTEDFSAWFTAVMEDIREMLASAENYAAEQNYAEAVKLWSMAAVLGNAQAQFKLGLCYDKGNGVWRDDKKACKWYKKAAEQGDADAQNHLGQCYFHGSGVAIDEAEACKWYRKAAEQGNTGARCSLGFCYRYGYGVAEDKAEAYRCYRKAAEQGNVYALRCLGECYYYGDGVAQDYEEACRWYRKGVEQGDGESLCYFAECYELRREILQNQEELYVWYQEARKNTPFRFDFYWNSCLGCDWEYEEGACKAECGVRLATCIAFWSYFKRHK